MYWECFENKNCRVREAIQHRLIPKCISSSFTVQGPTVAVRNALVAGNHPLTAFSFLHPECGGKIEERSGEKAEQVCTMQPGRRAGLNYR